MVRTGLAVSRAIKRSAAQCAEEAAVIVRTRAERLASARAAAEERVLTEDAQRIRALLESVPEAERERAFELLERLE